MTVLAPDRVGLLADVAAVLALQRVDRALGPGVGAGVRRTWPGRLVWEVAEPDLDAAVLRERLARDQRGPARRRLAG